MIAGFKKLLSRSIQKHSLSTSQVGQDIWIYGEAFNEKRNGYFLDIGAHDGLTFSNSFLLEHKYGWKGLCIEANPMVFDKLQRNRKVPCLNLCLNHREGEVDFLIKGCVGRIVGLDNKEYDKEWVVKLKTTTLMKVLEEHKSPETIDYLSIDVEGAEERILSCFNFNRYLFRCITIERPTEYLKDLFKRNGYVLIRELRKLDSLYVHEDFLDRYHYNLFEFYKKRFIAFRWR